MYDAIVVGAGPGGATAAAFMAESGLRVLLLEKDTFPKDKICGDAISGRAVEILNTLHLVDAFEGCESHISWGITLSSPAGDQVHIPFTNDRTKPIPPGFVCTRTVFDDVVRKKATQSGATLIQGASVTGLLKTGDAVSGVRYTFGGETKEAIAPLVVGADGAYSVVSRQLGLNQLDEEHYSAGIRAYYSGVTGFTEENYIELHFAEASLPGYFWIFPLANGHANVGIGMLSSEIKKRGINLNGLLPALTASPQFSQRFAGATLLGPPKGWGLPMGSKPKPMAGNGWMLLGDAASLIDPFTGEGIGNAMLSGVLAAEWASKAHQTKDFSTAFLSGYDRSVLERLQPELNLSHTLQRMARRKWFLNMIIGKASRSKAISEAMSDVFDNLDARKKLASPFFVLKLLFA